MLPLSPSSLLLTLLIGVIGVHGGPCHPIDNARPIKDGDFEGARNLWTFSDDNEVGGSLVSGGYNSEKKFYSYNMIDNNLLEMYQDMQTIPGTKYRCTYNWYFDNYYETVYQNGKTYVPYLRFYFGDELVGNRWPTGEYQTGNWLNGEFSFESTGKDRIWIDAASPQPPTGPGGGDNHLSIDNIVCEIVA